MLVNRGRRACALVVLVLCASVCAVDYYKVLGLKKGASLKEIKRAYRAKALVAHPDKAAPGEEAKATDQFRQIAEAYETLSDPVARRQYDAGGGTGARGRGGGGGRGDDWSWWTGGGFGGGGGGFGGHGGGYQWTYRSSWSSGSHRTYEPYLPPEVRRAQERPIKLSSLEHLRATAFDENGIAERALLLALSSGSSECKRLLKYTLQFPYPFAGWSNAAMGSGLWWEDLLQTYIAELHAGSPLAAAFGYIPSADRCPQIIYVAKGKRLEEHEVLPATHRAWRQFSDWVWARLRTKVLIVNHHHSDVQLWWATGTSAHKLAVLKPGEEMQQESYLSHTFFAWDLKTEGHTLAENALLAKRTLRDWGTTELHVRTRCVDRHGTCMHWTRMGECRRNGPYMDANCPRSCGRCPDDDGCVDREEACGSWAAEGHCEANPGWMRPNCPRSCGQCAAQHADKRSGLGHDELR